MSSLTRQDSISYSESFNKNSDSSVKNSNNELSSRKSSENGKMSDLDCEERPPKKMSDSTKSSEEIIRVKPESERSSKNRTRNSSSSNSGSIGSNKQSRKTSEQNSRSHSPRLLNSLSLDGSDSRPLKFEIGPPLDPFLGIQQESYSSVAYGGLSHHAISRLSATSSLNEADFGLDDSSLSSTQILNLDESLTRLEAKSSSSDLYTTPTNTLPCAQPSSLPTPLYQSLSSTSWSAVQSGNGFRKKKSSWNSAIFPTYKSRSNEFKKLFTSLPSDERLIVEYSCALQKDILVHGRLYCTVNFLCFYANIFRCKTLITIKWEDVITVTKEKMLLFPNAIQISTKTEKLFFTSFAARDRTYDTLIQLWKPESAVEHWHWVHALYGDELGLTSEDEADYVSQFGGVSPSPSAILAGDDSPQVIHSRKISKSATSPGSLSDTLFKPITPSNTGTSSRSNTSSETGGGRILGKIEESRSLQDDLQGEDGSDCSQGPLDGDPVRPCRPGVTSQSSSDLKIPAGLSNSDVSDISSESDSDLPNPGKFELSKSEISTKQRSRVTLDSWRSSLQEGREMTCQTFPIDVDTLFQLLFTNSKFFIDFHTERKTLDIVQSSWQSKDDGSQDKVREVSFTLSLTNSMGYKHSQVTETQTMSHESCPGQIYLINVETNNSGIPYADSFFVTSQFCLSKVYDRQSNLCVISSIKYKKAVWGLVKALIGKNTWAGLEDFYGSLTRSLQMTAADLGQGVKTGNKKSKNRSRAVPEFESQDSFSHPSPIREITSPGSLASKRGRPASSSSTANGVIVGDTLSQLVRPPSVTSSTSTTVNNFLVKFILFLLSTLLIINILLFYRLHNLETRLERDDLSTPYTPDANLFLVKPDFPRSEDDWVKLMQRQESLHQLELEKWHDLLGSATHLLRQTEESLTDLQKTIHPLALRKLRQLLLMQDLENSADVPSQTLKQEPPPEKSSSEQIKKITQPQAGQEHTVARDKNDL